MPDILFTYGSFVSVDKPFFQKNFRVDCILCTLFHSVVYYTVYCILLLSVVYCMLYIVYFFPSVYIQVYIRVDICGVFLGDKVPEFGGV